MIYSELKNLLTGLASSEVVDAFDEGVRILDKYEVPEYMEVFERSIERASELGNQAVLDAVQLDLKIILDYALKMQGIVLDADITMSQRNLFADTMYEIAYYEDKAALKDILNSEETVPEKFAELMELMTPYSTDEVMALVEDIDESFVINFQQILNEQNQTDIGEAELVKSQISAYRGFKEFCENAPLFADRFFANLGAIGLEYRFYFDFYKNSNPEVTTDTISQVVKELVGLACLSRDASATPLLTIRPLLTVFFSDIVAVTKADIALTDITLAWGAAK